MGNNNRVQPGVPTGGQFAAQSHDEADITLEEPVELPEPKVHSFESSGEAYDRSQTDDDIDDGDILVIPSEGVVGVLVKAWPVAVTDNVGTFHTTTGGWDQFLVDNRQYEEAYRFALDASLDLPTIEKVPEVTSSGQMVQIVDDEAPGLTRFVIPYGERKETEPSGFSVELVVEDTVGCSGCGEPVNRSGPGVRLDERYGTFQGNWPDQHSCGAANPPISNSVIIPAGTPETEARQRVADLAWSVNQDRSMDRLRRKGLIIGGTKSD